VCNLQHLREYKSCRIWASQSRRPPYVTGVEGRTRIEGVTRKLYGRSQQQGGRRRRLHNPLRGDHLRRGPPIPGGPVEIQEQAAENDGTPRQVGQPSSDVGGDTSANNIRRGDTPTNKICRGAPRATYEQDRITNKMVWFRSPFFISFCCGCYYCCRTRSPTPTTCFFIQVERVHFYTYTTDR